MATYYVDGSVGNDTNAGTSAGAGNAWLTVSKALSTLANGDLCYVKASATYSIGTGLTANTGGGAVSYSSRTRIVGYTTTPGDGGRATIRATAAITGLTVSGVGWAFENIDLDGNSVGTTGASVSGGSYSNNLYNCLIRNWTAEGLVLGDACAIVDCEITGCGGTNGSVLCSAGFNALTGCKIHGNTKTGIYHASTASVILRNCRIYANTGASSDGVFVGIYTGFAMDGCTVHGNGRHGLFVSGYNIITDIRNSIFTSNGGYGLNLAAMATAAVDPAVDYNWFGSGGLANTSGARNVILAGPHDLSGDPGYANAAAGDFTPSNASVQAGSP